MIEAKFISDITGVTGLRILRDIVAGQRDPEHLAQHRDHRCRASKAEIVAAVLALLALPAISAAQVVEGDGTDRWLKLAWMVGAGHITGRIYNEYVHPAERIRLVVEARDASDNLVSQRYEWVGGIVPALGDRYFDVPTPGVAHHYRVAVASYTFKRGP